MRCTRLAGGYAAAGLVAVALLLPSLARASDGVEPISVSSQALSRGGADVAIGDSALSQIDNPATLALSPRDRSRFDAAGELATVHLQWRSPVDSDSVLKLAPLINSGMAIPLNDRLTVGAALHSKAGFSSEYRVRHLLIPFMERRVGSDLKVVSMPLNVAYRVSNKLSIGGGIRAEMAAAEFSTVLGPADLEFGRGYAFGGGFQLGLHYRPRDNLSLGLGYRSPTWTNDLGGGDGKASVLGLLPIRLGGVCINDLRLPQKITAGTAWDVTSWLKLAGEVRWLNYGNSSLHSTTISAGHLGALRFPFPLGYHDQWAFIVGADIKLREGWKLGVGYHYVTPAVPRPYLLPVGSVITQHHATLGLRYEAEKWWAGGGYVVGFPASLHSPQYSRIPLGIDYGNSTLRQTQHGISVGFGFRW